MRCGRSQAHCMCAELYSNVCSNCGYSAVLPVDWKTEIQNVTNVAGGEEAISFGVINLG